MKFLKTNKEIKPLDFLYYYIPVLVVALLGLSDALYLAVSHYRIYTDISYKSFCAISYALNCDTVSMSPYAIFGGLPVPDWGVIGYLIVLGVILFAGGKNAGKKRLWPLLFWISLFFSLISIILAGVSEFLIHTYCIMCIFSYLINFTLVYYAWFINRRFNDAGLFRGAVADCVFIWEQRKKTFPVAFIFLLAVTSFALWLPKYWHMTLPPLTRSMPTGMTSKGYPWIGSKHPVLVITEFSDYMCPHCRKFHFNLRQFMEKHPGKIRLIHRNFPMDSSINPVVTKPYHEGSAELAILAIYAAEHNKFWQMNDYLFRLDINKKSALNIKKIAKNVGLDEMDAVHNRYNRHLWILLAKDISDALRLGVRGTPAFVIDGKVYQGYIPTGILDKAIE